MSRTRPRQNFYFNHAPRREQLQQHEQKHQLFCWIQIILVFIIVLVMNGLLNVNSIFSFFGGSFKASDLRVR
jgi:uncharacterized integral membrane protein